MRGSPRLEMLYFQLGSSPTEISHPNYGWHCFWVAYRLHFSGSDVVVLALSPRVFNRLLTQYFPVDLMNSVG